MKFFDRKEPPKEDGGESEKKEKASNFKLKDLFARIVRKITNLLSAPFGEFGEDEKELFERQFNPREYIELYYPPIDKESVKHISDILARVEVREMGEDGVKLTKIDGRLLARQFEHGSTEGKSIELLENYCIYDFVARKALPAMLTKRPEDHFSVLDVGGGPTVYQHIPLLGVSDKITHAEYLEANRQEIATWKQEKGYDWSSYIACWQSYLALHPEAYSMAMKDVRDVLDNLSTKDPSIYNQEMAKRIEDVIPVDVFSPNILSSQEGYDAVSVGKWGCVDLLTSHFCIESATADPNRWRIGIGNIAKKVNEGGFLIMTAIRNAEWYKVGDNKLPAVPVDYTAIANELKKHGFKVLEGTELLTHNQKEVGYDGMIFILVQKQ
ncbi:MAG: hypothetical protein WCW16_02510 [Candidatus Magasanikbacteria bacterium]